MMRSYPERLYKLTSWRIGMWPRGSAISRKTRCTQRGGVASSRSSASAGSAQDLGRCKAQPPMAIACYCLPPELPSAACPTRCLSLCEREGGICSKLLQAGVIEFEQFQRGVAAWKFMPLLVARCDHGHLSECILSGRFARAADFAHKLACSSLCCSMHGKRVHINVGGPKHAARTVNLAASAVATNTLC